MTSAWEIEMPEFERLDHDAEADVAIIGGGLAGVWCAYLLSKEGRKVVLVDKDRLGHGATLYTTGFVTEVIDTNLYDLVKMFGDKKAALSWQAGAEAIDLIERVVEEEGIDCEFMRLPILSYATDEGELESLKREAAEAKRLGFEASISDEPIEGVRSVGALEVSNQAKYHPMKFFKGLIAAAKESGVEFYEKTEALEVHFKRGPEVVLRGGHRIAAKDVIVTTYDPLNNPEPTHWKKGMYVSYVYELELPQGELPEFMAEDQHNPYHYVRVDNLGQKMRMIVGGEDHRAEIRFEDSKSFKALKEYIDNSFPGLDYSVKGRWQGEILEPSDGLPLIGKYAPHQYLAAAFSGNGMTYSAISGRLLTDLIMGRESQYRELYDPKRKIDPKAFLTKARDYAEEFFGGAVKNLFK